MHCTEAGSLAQPHAGRKARQVPRGSRRPLSIGIFGASGTTGAELARLCDEHSHCSTDFATSRTFAGRSLRAADPAAPDVPLIHPGEAQLDTVDVVFVCIPHGEAASVVERCVQAETKVIDLSGDLRLRGAQLHARVYGTKRSEEIASQAVYGLTEFFRPSVQRAQIVSNPGCYSTCAAIALSPLASRGLLPDTVVIDAKSGISGAGRQATETTHYCSVSNDVRPYKLGRSHRHTEEIEQTLRALGSAQRYGAPRVLFCPHVVPLERGMLVTIVLEVPTLTAREVLEIYMETYDSEPFVEVLPLDEPARIRGVAYSNRAVVGIHSVPDTRHVVITCAIDNLLKGAAGQAVQNMNLMFGLPETLGLASTPLVAGAQLRTDPNVMEVS